MPVSDEWSCPRCHRGTVVTGSPADVQAALDGVRDRHDTGRGGIGRCCVRWRRRGRRRRGRGRPRGAAARAAARRRRNKADRT